MNETARYMEQNNWHRISSFGADGCYYNRNLFVFSDGSEWIVSKTQDQSGRYSRGYKNMLSAFRFADSKSKNF